MANYNSNPCSPCNDCNNPCRPEVTPVPCSQPVAPCVSCSATINTDCIIYNDERFPFEAGNIKLGDPRILTDILKNFTNTATSAYSTVNFNKGYVTSPILTSYTVKETDSTVVISSLLDINNMAAYYTIVLPGSPNGVSAEPFKGKSIKFINVSATNPTNGITFSTGVRYAFSPNVLTSADFAALLTARGSSTTVEIMYLPNHLGVFEWILV